jgi:hypothetical protein
LEICRYIGCFFVLLLHRVMRMRLMQKHSTSFVEGAPKRLRGIKLLQVNIGARRLRGLTKMTLGQLGLLEALEALEVQKKTGQHCRVMQPCAQ